MVDIPDQVGKPKARESGIDAQPDETDNLQYGCDSLDNVVDIGKMQNQATQDGVHVGDEGDLEARVMESSIGNGSSPDRDDSDTGELVRFKRDNEPLSNLQALKLSATEAYYSISGALRLHKLRDLLWTGGVDLSRPVWLVGKKYDASEHDDQDELMFCILHHVQSIPYMSYRKGFMPLKGGLGLTSDAGWGCTLRVSQMLVALALQRAILGSNWRFRNNNDGLSEHEDGALATLRLFYDLEPSPLSLHSICEHGIKYGVSPGRWVGPSAASKAVASAIDHAGLQIRACVLSSGGGAPMIYTESVEELIRDEGETCKSLLLLIPVVLGVGKINPVYIPQLLSILEIQQSLGIIGGTSKSSLFLIGHQDTKVLYLDPHQLQPAACSDDSLATYRCDALRVLSATSIDSSASFGFLCRDKEDYISLLNHLALIEEQNRSSPIICIREGREPSEDGTGIRDVSLWEGESCNDEEVSLSPMQTGKSWEVL